MLDLSTFTSADQTPLNTTTFPATILTSAPQVLWQNQQWTSVDQALPLSSPLNVLLRLFPLLHEIYFSALISTLQYYGLFSPPNLPFPGLSPSVSSDTQSLDFNYLEVMNLFENPLSIKNLSLERGLWTYMIFVHNSEAPILNPDGLKNSRKQTSDTPSILIYLSCLRHHIWANNIPVLMPCNLPHV